MTIHKVIRMIHSTITKKMWLNVELLIFLAIIEESDDNFNRAKSSESLPSMYNNDGSSSSLEPDINPDEQEEKARLISQVLELQNTLDGEIPCYFLDFWQINLIHSNIADLSQRVDGVKEENLKLRSENQVLGQYIENLMSASSVFQSTNTTTKKK